MFKYKIKKCWHQVYLKKFFIESTAFFFFQQLFLYEIHVHCDATGMTHPDEGRGGVSGKLISGAHIERDMTAQAVSDGTWLVVWNYTHI